MFELEVKNYITVYNILIILTRQWLVANQFIRDNIFTGKNVSKIPYAMVGGYPAYSMQIICHSAGIHAAYNVF